MSMIILKERLLRENSELREKFTNAMAYMAGLPNSINSSWYFMYFLKEEYENLLKRIRKINEEIESILPIFEEIDKKANEKYERYTIESLLTILKNQGEDKLNADEKEVLILYFEYEDLEAIKKYGMDENGEVLDLESFYKKVKNGK